MPRDSSGNYTLPAGNPVVDGTIIETTWANPTMADIAAQLNNVLTRDGLLGPTAPFLVVSGTESQPGLAFASQIGTGLWRDATQAAFSYQGSKIFSVNASGLSMATGKTVTSSGSMTVSGGVQAVLNLTSTVAFSSTGASFVALNDPGGYRGGMGFGGYANQLDILNSLNGPISFWVNNTKRAQLNANGSFSILGGATGAVILESTGNVSSTGYAYVAFRDVTGDVGSVGFGGISNQVDVVNSRAGSIAFWTNAAKRMDVGSTGNVVPGADNTQDFGASGTRWKTLWCTVVADGAAGSMLASSGTAFLVGGGSQWTEQRFFTGGNERMRLGSNGTLSIGTTAVQGLVTIYYNRSSQNALVIKPDADLGAGGAITFLNNAQATVGSIYTDASTTTYATSSDYRLKNVDGVLQDAGDIIDALRPVQGTWKANGERFVGFLAHEVAEVIPSAVVGEKDGEHMQVMSYSNAELITCLVAEVQDLRRRVASLGV